MKGLDFNPSWPILTFVILFLVLPVATLPGFFNVIFVVLIGIALVIGALLIASLVSSRARSRDQQG